MPAVRVRTTLGPDTLRLPELIPLLGREVELQVSPVHEPADPFRTDPQVIERLRREMEAAGPVPTLEEVRALLSVIPGSLADDIIAARG